MKNFLFEFLPLSKYNARVMEKGQQNKAQRQLNPEKWVQTHGDYLYRFALGRLRNSSQAENVVQETFLAAFKGLKTFKNQASERTWLTAILKYKIIDHLRAQYKEKPLSDLQADQRAVDSFFDEKEHPKKYPTDWSPNPLELVKRSEFWKIFEECMKKLPKSTANAFQMREMDKQDVKEICKILKLSSTNLYVMLHRARLQLRGCLEKNWFEK